ncbi:MAG: hypothetical protein PHW52_03780 [Candidatus Pacebacteria bacterium]|nr:hypothetical protein [Candidatus Paceibacterota bacterium]
MEKLTVFFGCSMRGSHSNVSCEELARIPSIIEGLGYGLASKHQTEEGIIGRENLLAKTDIHDRDYEWLLSSDSGVFEISNPSLGVGAEISDMVHDGKPVLCVYKDNDVDGDDISAYVLGKQGSRFISSIVECRSYSTFEDLKMIIQEFLARVLAHDSE